MNISSALNVFILIQYMRLWQDAKLAFTNWAIMATVTEEKHKDLVYWEWVRQKGILYSLQIISKMKHQGLLKPAAGKTLLLSKNHCHWSWVSPHITYRHILDNQRIVVWFLEWAKHFFLLQNIYTSSGSDAALCPEGTRSFFPRDKTAKAWSWPPTSMW